MDFQIGFTDKEITPWGGMALMKKMMDRCGLEGLISALGLPELVPCNIKSFVFTQYMVSLRQLNHGGRNVAKISSNTDQGGA